MHHKEKSGLATAGMVLGIIGICLSWIPIINNAAFVLAALALIFGIVGIVQTKNNKKSGRGKAITAVVLAIITIIVVIAVQSALGKAFDDATNGNDGKKVGEAKPSSKPEKTTFKVGDIISFDGKKVTVTKVERNWSSGDEFMTPDAGKEYVKVNVTIENNSDSEVSYNTYDWKIQDTEGTVQDPAFAVTASDDLDSGDLIPGGKKAGSVIFEVPAGDKNLTLRYEPSFWSDKKVEIKL